MTTTSTIKGIAAIACTPNQIGETERQDNGVYSEGHNWEREYKVSEEEWNEFIEQTKQSFSTQSFISPTNCLFAPFFLCFLIYLYIFSIVSIQNKKNFLLFRHDCVGFAVAVIIIILLSNIT